MAQPRILPHRPEAENAVLGGVLLRGKEAMAEVLTLITEDDFYQPRAQAVFRAMRILEERGEPIDVITLEAQLRRTGELELVGGIEGIARLDRYATAHNIKAHAELIAESAQVRNLVVTTREIAEEGMEEVEDPAEFVDRAEQRVFAVRSKSRRAGPRHVSAAMLEVFQGITERQRSDTDITGIATPWTPINDMTAGLQPSDLLIVAARPSMGKTQFGLDIAAHAAISQQKHVQQIQDLARNKYSGDERSAYLELIAADKNGKRRIQPRVPTLVFSLEMAEAQLLERVLCSQARVDAQAIRRGGRIMESDFRALISAAERISNYSDLYVDERPALSITEIRSAARVWAARNLIPLNPDEPDESKRKNLGLVMVDYLQLARGGKARYDSREQEISEISRGLKAMAKELKVPVIALSQLNRAVDSRADHRPQLSDLRESGAIEQDADVIMFIYREERYLSADAPEEKRQEVENKAEIIIGKQRNGPIGTVKLTFMKKYTRFENPVDDDRGW